MFLAVCRLHVREQTVPAAAASALQALLQAHASGQVFVGAQKLLDALWGLLELVPALQCCVLTCVAVVAGCSAAGRALRLALDLKAQWEPQGSGL